MVVDVKKGLKKVVDSFKKTQKPLPESQERMQRIQETARKTSEEIQKER